MGDSALSVLFVFDWFPDPQTGGTETQVWLLLCMLRQAGVRIRILLLRRSVFLEENLPEAEIICLDIRKILHPRSLWSALRVAVQARAAGFRVAHIFFNDSAVLFPMPLWAAGIRVLVARRDLGFWYTERNLRWLRFNRHFVDQVVANCEAVKRNVVEHEGYRPDRVRVILNGIECSVAPTSDQVNQARARIGLRPDDRMILLVANLRPLKRVFDVIRALPKVREAVPGARLFVAGGDHPGEHRGHAAELSELVRTCGVQDAVVFLGRVDDPRGYIAAAHVCVLASESEGLSNSLLEYACARRAIVCTDVGGNPEVVRTPQDGLLYRPGDVDTLAAHLTALLTDPQRAAALGDHVAESVRARFSTSLLLGQHLTIYGNAPAHREASAEAAR